mgnify:CR=1 FL=1
MSGRLAGKVAVVTGAGGGQGRAVIRRFAAEGAYVVALDLTIPPKVRDSVSDSGTVRFLEADVSDRATIGRVRESVREYGGCDILYNNAGLYLPGRGDGPAGDVDLDTWDRILRVNLTGAYYMIDAVLPSMVERKGGVILNVASLAGVVGGASAAYTASKAGLIGLTKSIASTHGPLGVRAVALSLGVIETEMSRFSKEQGKWDEVLESIPVRRAAQPEEIASWAVFLASDEASYANGANIVIDGGRGVGLR